MAAGPSTDRETYAPFILGRSLLLVDPGLTAKAGIFRRRISDRRAEPRGPRLKNLRDGRRTHAPSGSPSGRAAGSAPWSADAATGMTDGPGRVALSMIASQDLPRSRRKAIVGPCGSP